jgi:hypothetical protein
MKTSPDHYRAVVKKHFQPVYVAKAWNLGFELFTAIKYIARCGHKPGETEFDDLSKAIWFLAFYLTSNTDKCDEIVKLLTPEKTSLP